ncbi:MAG: calcium-binding protein [bacterium]
MAYVTFSTAFDAGRVDFHQAFKGLTLPITLPPQSLTIPALSLDLLGVTADLKEQHIDIDETVVVRFGADQQLTMGGSGLDPTWAGRPTAGTISLLSMSGTAAPFLAVGLDLDGAVFGAAAASSSISDDAAVMRAVFAGNDLVRLSGGNDLVDTGPGRDLIIDSAGADTIRAGDGGDLVAAGSGDDLVAGGAGRDILLGAGGADRLSGGARGDILSAGPGDDTLTGGNGSDVFIFTTGDGADLLRDFSVVHDQILITGSATSLNDLTLTQHGSSARITFDDVTITLRHVDPHSLTDANFLFNDATPLTDALQNFFTGWQFIA